MGGGFDSQLNLAILVCCKIVPDLTRVHEVEKRDSKVSLTCVMLQFKVVKTDRSSANLNLLGISVFSLLFSCKPPNSESIRSKKPPPVPGAEGTVEVDCAVAVVGADVGADMGADGEAGIGVGGAARVEVATSSSGNGQSSGSL